MAKTERRADHGDEALHALRHSTAHVMAGAVLELFPEAKFGFGPPVADGFYYDFELPRSLTPDDLVAIEDRMRAMVKADLPFERSAMAAPEARAFFDARGQDFKVDQIDKLEETVGENAVGIYRHGSFVDLCRGPHVERTSKIGPFKLLSIAGAYWRGDEKNAQLQRVYGTVWETQADLDAYLARLAEAEKRDHRKIGQELELFHIDDELGSGLVLWLPNGSIVREELENWWRQVHHARGYTLGYTPHIGAERIYERSGHLGNYRENMYGPIALDQEFWVKPMNCPGHIKIFQARQRSYRELPLRLGELGTVYRYERGGTLHGLSRVRGFTQDDSHIFCTREQFSDEVAGVLDLVLDGYRLFGWTPEVRLSTRPDKRIGTDAEWDEAEESLRQAIVSRGLSYKVDAGGGVFYGPKIDIDVTDAIERRWQLSTIQLDLQLPQRFDVTFVNAAGVRERAVMVHRVLFGSIERFFSVLIEHFAGKFPLWLQPAQVAVIPVRDSGRAYAEEVAALLRGQGIRVWLDPQQADLRTRIKEANLMRANYTLVVGEKEAAIRAVSVRKRGAGQGEEERGVPLDGFVQRVVAERDARALPHDFTTL